MLSNNNSVVNTKINEYEQAKLVNDARTKIYYTKIWDDLFKTFTSNKNNNNPNNIRGNF